jgi:enediyne biosynthesis protein E4
LSQSELPLTFGLGKPAPNRTATLEIVWPSGRKESISGVRPNQFITVTEGKGVTSSHPIDFSRPTSHR